MEINDPSTASQNDLSEQTQPDATAPEATEAPSGTDACADLSTEPRRVAFPVWQGRPPARSITYGWVVSTDGDGTEVLVELACHHSAPGYVARINNMVRKPNGSVLYSPLDARLVLTEQVSRYAKAKFTAFAERALAELRSSADQEEIAAYLRGDHRVEH
jgi:hypothetical protein